MEIDRRLYQSQKLVTQYQMLLEIIKNVGGNQILDELMEYVTEVLVKMFNTLVCLHVVDAYSSQTYPPLNGFSQGTIAESTRKNIKSVIAKPHELTEIDRHDGLIVAPMCQLKERPSLVLLLIIDEAREIDLEATRSKLEILSDAITPTFRRMLFEEERERAKEFGRLIGESQPMREVKKQILAAAPNDITILIQGETGTGKELVARAIHQNSTRKDQPFVAVNCGAIPESLIESELFGHVEGAFTNATKDRQGLFKQADGGTIFLDEIGDMPLDQQVKLLRVLEEKEIRPLGYEKLDAIEVNVRVIAATNQDLYRQVEMGRFREDLYYRLAKLDIKIPPLRKRGKDTLNLANSFLPKGRSLHPDVESALEQYSWPGNVRELENVIGRAVLGADDEITLDNLPMKVTQPQNTSPEPVGSHQPTNTGVEALRQMIREEIKAHATHTNPDTLLRELCADQVFAVAVSNRDLATARENLERFLIEKAWQEGRSSGKSEDAIAKELGISRSQLRNRIERFCLGADPN